MQVLAGGTSDDRDGYFIRPTIVLCEDPRDGAMTTEYVGPILAVHVFDDDAFDAQLTEVDQATPYALTGAVFAQDRAVLSHAQQSLRFAAGNLYLNDKPTAAVVGQQPLAAAGPAAPTTSGSCSPATPR